jgi:hypothetical protein
MCPTYIGTAWMAASTTSFGGTNINCHFRDEAADSGDQLKAPLDLGRQMDFHVRRSAFMSESIAGLIRPFPPLH